MVVGKQDTFLTSFVNKKKSENENKSRKAILNIPKLTL